MYMKLKKEYKTADVWISDPGKTWEVFEMLKCKKSLETKQTELLLPRTFLILILVQQPQKRTWQDFNEDLTYPQ